MYPLARFRRARRPAPCSSTSAIRFIASTQSSTQAMSTLNAISVHAAAQTAAHLRLPVRTADGTKTSVSLPLSLFTTYVTHYGSRPAFREALNAICQRSHPVLATPVLCRCASRSRLNSPGARSKPTPDAALAGNFSHCTTQADLYKSTGIRTGNSTGAAPFNSTFIITESTPPSWQPPASNPPQSPPRPSSTC